MVVDESRTGNYNNESLVSFFKELQLKKIELIKSLEDKSKFDKMIDYVVENSDLGMYSNVIIINGEVKVTKSIMESKDIQNIYNNYAIGGGVERRFFKPGLKADNKIVGGFKLDLRNIKYQNEYTVDKNIINSNKQNIIEQTQLINFPKDINDDTKLKLIETILDKQKELIELTNSNNKYLIYDVAQKSLSKAYGGTIYQDSKTDQVAELMPTLIKSMYGYNHTQDTLFNTYLFNKLKSEGIIQTTSKIKEMEIENSHISLEDQEEKMALEGRTGVIEQVLEEVEHSKLQIGSDKVLDVLYEWKVNVPDTKSYFSKITNLDILENKISYTKDQQTNMLNIIDFLEKESGKNDALEFLKAGLKYNNILKDELENYNVDDKWIETYKQYMDMKANYKDTVEKLFAIKNEEFEEYISDVEEDIIKQELVPFKSNNIKSFNFEHREFLGELLEKEYYGYSKMIENIKYDKDTKVGNELSLYREEQYKNMLITQEYKTGVAINVDSKLLDIDVETIDTREFSFKQKHSLLEDVSLIYSMNKDQLTNLRNGIAEFQTKGNYKNNDNGLYGKYSFDIATLAEYGIINSEKLMDLSKGKSSSEIKTICDEFVKDNSNWNTKYCKSLEDFYSKRGLQDSIMENILVRNFKDMNEFVTLDKKQNFKFGSLDELRPWEIGGLLAAAHIGGPERALELAINGRGNNDKMGKLIEKFYKVGRESSMVDVNQSLAALDMKQHQFVDPKGNYQVSELVFNPLCSIEYFGKLSFELGKTAALLINSHRYEKQEELNKKLELSQDTLLDDNTKDKLSKDKSSFLETIDALNSIDKKYENKSNNNYQNKHKHN